jgi:hypothetical protein
LATAIVMAGGLGPLQEVAARQQHRGVNISPS